MKRELILEEWNRYLAMTHPRPIPPQSAALLRMAFFGGASAVLKVLMNNLGEDGPSAADVQMVRDVRDEVQEFARKVGRHRS